MRLSRRYFTKSFIGAGLLTIANIEKAKEIDQNMPLFCLILKTYKRQSFHLL
jgi:hypothetical protein